jgi:ACR3 family arsenite transporter
MSALESQNMATDSPTTPSSLQKQTYPDPDLETHQQTPISASDKIIPVIKGLGWLDRFLAVWILLAMIIGVLLGNFVESTGPALQKGKFVGVSIPIAVGLLGKRLRCTNSMSDIH